MTKRAKRKAGPPDFYKVHCTYGGKWRECHDFKTLTGAIAGVAHLKSLGELYTDIGIYLVEQRKVR